MKPRIQTIIGKTFSPKLHADSIERARKRLPESKHALLFVSVGDDGIMVITSGDPHAIIIGLKELLKEIADLVTAAKTDL